MQTICATMSANFRVMTMAHLYHFGTFKLCQIFFSFFHLTASIIFDKLWKTK